jgi:hypothetical protein
LSADRPGVADPATEHTPLIPLTEERKKNPKTYKIYIWGESPMVVTIFKEAADCQTKKT